MIDKLSNKFESTAPRETFREYLAQLGLQKKIYKNEIIKGY